MDKTEVRKQILDKLYRYNYWFCNEMMKEEEKVKEFEAACKKAEQEETPVIIVSGSAGNVKCMRHCMEATAKIITFLRNKEEQEYIEAWQLAGIQAILEQCKEDQVVPFDLPYAIQGILGM